MPARKTRSSGVRGHQPAGVPASPVPSPAPAPEPVVAVVPADPDSAREGNVENGAEDSPPTLAETVAASPPDEATPQPRKRGRPRKEVVEPVVFSAEYPETDFSLTVVSRGQHIRPFWLDALSDFCDATALRYSLSRERGGRNEHLHVQGVVTWAALTTTESINNIKKKIKDTLGVKRGDESKW